MEGPDHRKTAPPPLMQQNGQKQNGGHQNGGKAITVTFHGNQQAGHAKVSRERSFMRPQAPQNFRPANCKVQRQRSCVANLFNSHQGHRHAVMPAAATASYIRPKPDMRLYRPPTLRVANDSTMTADGNHGNGNQGNGNHGDQSSKPGLNINAKEFVCLGPTGGSVPQSALKHSKSYTQIYRSKASPKLALRLNSPPLRVHFTDDTNTNDLETKVGSGGPMKRSNSVGCAADLSKEGGGGLSKGGGDPPTPPHAQALQDMAPLDKRTLQKLEKVAANPTGCGARLVMEAVRELLSHVVMATRHADPGARYCLAVIEKEGNNGNFIETLQNTCQEYFQEKQSLLPLTPPPHHPNKWLGYITFLLEMYSQLKRKRRSVSTLLLSLLAECCIVTLSQPPSLQQTECLFFTLTVVGRDLETELPAVMSRVIAAARDALFETKLCVPAVRKTLLQLIEMNAANWQLSGTAVMYYHPSVGIPS